MTYDNIFGVEIYWILLIVCVLFCGFSYFFNDKLAKKILMIPYVLLTVFSGFRYYVGYDFAGYMKIFYNSVASGYNIENIEPGYYFLINLANEIGGTQQLVFFLVAC